MRHLPNGKPVVRMLPAPVQQQATPIQQQATPIHQYDAYAGKKYTPPVPNRFKVSTGSLTRSATKITDNQTPDATPPEPTVYFTQDAMAKMKHIVASCTLEVGWMALVKNPMPNIYLIHEVFIPTQTVTAVETDISGDAMSTLAMELLDKGHDTSELYAWFHSHVNMGVTPSSQDERQVEEFLESCPVFIRGIMNKRNELKVDVYFTTHNVAYNAVPTQVYMPPLSADALAELDAEIAAKVTQRQYNQGAYGRNAYGHNTPEGSQGLRDWPVGGKKNNAAHPGGPHSGRHGWGEEWGYELVPDDTDELTPLNDDNPSWASRRKLQASQTQFGIDWDETTPLSLRPQGWGLDKDYLAEGQAFDLYVS